MGKTIKTSTIFLLLFMIYIFIASLKFTFTITEAQHFILLAQSFLQKKLYFTEIADVGLLDMVAYKGNYYWHLGPFPAVLLLPFVWISGFLPVSFYQEHIHVMLILGILFLSLSLALRVRYNLNDAIILTLVFMFGSIGINYSMNAASWYLSHTISIFLALLAFYEYYHKKRYFLIGIMVAALCATRFTAGLIGIFFIGSIFFKDKPLKQKIINLIALIIPIIIGGGLLLLYNYLRFNTLLDNGYMTNLITNNYLIENRQQYGLFNLFSIPRNVYWYFFALPEITNVQISAHTTIPLLTANPHGMSFFLSSPFFIFLIKKTWKTTEEKLLWITSLITLFVLLMYYATGFAQVGPRYMLDLLPVWYILLLGAFKKHRLNLFHYTIAITSVMSNIMLYIFSASLR